jgi:hypothetical protein
MSFSDDSWTDRNWETKTYQHYKVQPYWWVIPLMILIGAGALKSRGPR